MNLLQHLFTQQEFLFLINMKKFELESTQDSVLAKPQEEGFSIIEVIISIVIIAIMSLGILTNILMALRSDKLIEVNQAAYNLALSKVEQFAAIQPSQLDASDNSTENAVAVSGMNITFTRVSQITVNADNSRTIQVDVSSDNSTLDTSVSYTTTFAVWE